MATSTDLYTIRNYSQGTTFKDVAIRGRSVSVANSVAVLKTNPPYNSKGAEHAPVSQIGNSIHQICNDFSH
ncbi:hypothetical protein [Sphingobacterium sp.]|uniref:hypothetical protein n=1 Tax=Sphingobacterium sp. TaxID=341027 RepID=UPI00289D603F|nr:hypothetical protein [Sphingobacterium sp.]